MSGLGFVEAFWGELGFQFRASGRGSQIVRVLLGFSCFGCLDLTKR